MVSASAAPSGASRASSPTSCAGADGVPPGSTSTRTSRSPLRGVASASFGRGSWNPAHRSAPPPPARRPRAAPAQLDGDQVASPHFDVGGEHVGARVRCLDRLREAGDVGRGPQAQHLKRQLPGGAADRPAPDRSVFRHARRRSAGTGENERARRGAAELRAASHLVRWAGCEVASETHGAFGVVGGGASAEVASSPNCSGAPARRRPGRGPRPPPKPPPGPSATCGGAREEPSSARSAASPSRSASGPAPRPSPKSARKALPSPSTRTFSARTAPWTDPPGGRPRGPRRPAPAPPRRRTRTPDASGDSCRE